MTEGVTNPKELRDIAGLSSVAEVYRTLDKLAIRKEYHKALAASGVSLNYIVEGLKGLADNSEKDDTRLKSFQTLLKSIGLDRYEKEETAAQGWEEAIIKAAEKKEIDSDNPKMIEGEFEEYKVDVPEVPEDEKEKAKEEIKLGRELYGE